MVNFGPLGCSAHAIQIDPLAVSLFLLSASFNEMIKSFFVLAYQQLSFFKKLPRESKSIKLALGVTLSHSLERSALIFPTYLPIWQ